MNLKPIRLLFLVLVLHNTTSHSQTFRLERPVPDTIQSHGNYLYGEPWFWAEGGAHRGLDSLVAWHRTTHHGRRDVFRLPFGDRDGTEPLRSNRCRVAQRSTKRSPGVWVTCVGNPVHSLGD